MAPRRTSSQTGRARLSHMSLVSAGGCAWCVQGVWCGAPLLRSCSTVCAALLSFSPRGQACPTLTSCLALAKNTFYFTHFPGFSVCG